MFKQTPKNPLWTCSLWKGSDSPQVCNYYWKLPLYSAYTITPSIQNKVPSSLYGCFFVSFESLFFREVFFLAFVDRWISIFLHLVIICSEAIETHVSIKNIFIRLNSQDVWHVKARIFRLLKLLQLMWQIFTHQLSLNSAPIEDIELDLGSANPLMCSCMLSSCSCFILK